jgi:hypothetical protein
MFRLLKAGLLLSFVVLVLSPSSLHAVGKAADLICEEVHEGMATDYNCQWPAIREVKSNGVVVARYQCMKGRPCQDITNGKITNGECLAVLRCSATETDGQKPSQVDFAPKGGQVIPGSGQPVSPDGSAASGEMPSLPKLPSGGGTSGGEPMPQQPGGIQDPFNYVNTTESDIKLPTTQSTQSLSPAAAFENYLKTFTQPTIGENAFETTGSGNGGYDAGKSILDQSQSFSPREFGGQVELQPTNVPGTVLDYNTSANQPAIHSPTTGFGANETNAQPSLWQSAVETVQNAVSQFVENIEEGWNYAMEQFTGGAQAGLGSDLVFRDEFGNVIDGPAPDSPGSSAVEDTKFSDVRDPIRAGTAQEQYLAAQRAHLMSELETNPKLRDRVAAVIAKEMGGGGPGSQAVLESMVNRALMRGYDSLSQAINDGFYGPVNRGTVDAYLNSGISAADRAAADRVIPLVAGGSNICNFCTDQGMVNEIKGQKWEIGGEYFGHMAGDARWANQQQVAISNFVPESTQIANPGASPSFLSQSGSPSFSSLTGGSIGSIPSDVIASANQEFFGPGPSQGQAPVYAQTSDSVADQTSPIVSNNAAPSQSSMPDYMGGLRDFMQDRVVQPLANLGEQFFGPGPETPAVAGGPVALAPELGQTSDSVADASAGSPPVDATEKRLAEATYRLQNAQAAMSERGWLQTIGDATGLSPSSQAQELAAARQELDLVRLEVLTSETAKQFADVDSALGSARDTLAKGPTSGDIAAQIAQLETDTRRLELSTGAPQDTISRELPTRLPANESFEAVARAQQLLDANDGGSSPQAAQNAGPAPVLPQQAQLLSGANPDTGQSSPGGGTQVSEAVTSPPGPLVPQTEQSPVSGAGDSENPSSSETPAHDVKVAQSDASQAVKDAEQKVTEAEKALADARQNANAAKENVDALKRAVEDARIASADAKKLESDIAKFAKSVDSAISLKDQAIAAGYSIEALNKAGAAVKALDVAIANGQALLNNEMLTDVLTPEERSGIQRDLSTMQTSRNGIEAAIEARDPKGFALADRAGFAAGRIATIASGPISGETSVQNFVNDQAQIAALEKEARADLVAANRQLADASRSYEVARSEVAVAAAQAERAANVPEFRLISLPNIGSPPASFIELSDTEGVLSPQDRIFISPQNISPILTMGEQSHLLTEFYSGLDSAGQVTQMAANNPSSDPFAESFFQNNAPVSTTESAGTRSGQELVTAEAQSRSESEVKGDVGSQREVALQRVLDAEAAMQNRSTWETVQDAFGFKSGAVNELFAAREAYKVAQENFNKLSTVPQNLEGAAFSGSLSSISPNTEPAASNAESKVAQAGADAAAKAVQDMTSQNKPSAEAGISEKNATQNKAPVPPLTREAEGFTPEGAPRTQENEPADTKPSTAQPTTPPVQPPSAGPGTPGGASTGAGQQGGGGMGSILEGLMKQLGSLFGQGQQQSPKTNTPPGVAPTSTVRTQAGTQTGTQTPVQPASGTAVAPSSPVKPMIAFVANPKNLVASSTVRLSWASINWIGRDEVRCETKDSSGVSVATGGSSGTATTTVASSTVFTVTCASPKDQPVSAQVPVAVQ